MPEPSIPETRAVQGAEDRLTALLDAAVDPIVLIDLAGRITRFSHAAERVFGYSSNDVVGRNVNMLMPAPYHAEHDHYLQRYLEGGQPRIIGIGREVVARRQDGSTFPIDLSVGEFEVGGERGFVGILRDITERKRHESALREVNEELQLIFDSTPTAITTTDNEGRIVAANSACESLLGYSADELHGRLHLDLVNDEDRAALAAQFNRLYISGDNFSCQTRYRGRDGSLIPVVMYAGTVHDEDNQPKLMVSQLIDRSALYAAEQEAEALRTRLTHVARLGTLGEMVSGIAHEVNQPLSAIANYANAVKRLLLSGKYEPGELALSLEKISAQAERAGEVIRGLRALTRRRDAEHSPQDCNALIKAIARLVDFDTRFGEHKLWLDLAPSSPMFYGDGVQFQQVVLNLIRNSLEAMSDSGHGDAVTVKSAMAGTHVEVVVGDRGPGLSADAQAHLFEPFFTTKARGMGLGLSICQSIVAAMNGQFYYRRGAAGGAEFVLKLPAIIE